jgi:predicted metal-dependent hydrolase
MSQKTVVLSDIGSVNIIKSSRNKSMRISVTHGIIRVSIPTWMPYAAGEAYVHAQRAWVAEHLAKRVISTLEDGQRVGKYHTMQFAPHSGATKARMTKTKIIVKYQTGLAPDAQEVQTIAKNAAIRALKKESERLLGPRLAELAKRHHIDYDSVSYKQLKRRWGSCDTQRRIVLNCFLVELPWELIDYVIIHELAHTKHMDHSAAFWGLCEQLLPDTQTRRKELKKYDPIVGAKKSARA